MKKWWGILLSLVLFMSACGASEQSNPKKTAKSSDDVVSFVGVGDNLIHETVYQDALQQDGSYDFTKMYKYVKATIKAADIAFINQETIIGGETLGLSGYPTFNSPNGVAKSIKEAGFDLVNMATNHSLDKGQAGIDNEVKQLTANKLIGTGAYDSQVAYDKIVTFKRKGITFAYLAYTYGTNGIVAPNPYSVRYFSDEQVTTDVQAAKKISDVVIVSAHWGDENTFAPNAFQTHYAQLFADLGVDVVIGTHPHTIQPIEWLKGSGGNKTLVFYSLGNFLGGMLTSDNCLGGIAGFDVKKSGKKYQVTNVSWTPSVIYYEGNQNDILNQRNHYRVYKLSDYSAKLGKKHCLNGYEGNDTSPAYFKAKTKSIIDKEYLK